MVVVAIEDAGETTDGFPSAERTARRTGEDFGHEERLGQEALDLTSADTSCLSCSDSSSILQDRDDVLQLLVALQHVLNAASGVVVFPDDQRIQLTEVESSGSTAG